LGAECLIASEPAAIAAAARVVFPGVGAAGAAMRHLRERGLDAVIRDVAASGKPFLGICLGTQILLDSTDEDGGTPTLGILPGRARRLQPSDPRAKVPHMGWNQ
jgi:glutamine amidotransferase